MTNTSITPVIQVPTPSMEKSLDYYSRLGFINLSMNEKTWVSDGNIVIEINPDRFARCALKFYFAEKIQLPEKFIESNQQHLHQSTQIFADPNGIPFISEILPAAQLPDYSKHPNSLCGKCYGFGIESWHYEKSLDFWTNLGFQLIQGGTDQAYSVLTHPCGMGLSIMKTLQCPHLFFNPSLNFFNGKNNLEFIREIRATGLPIAEEISVFNDRNEVDNVILRDPGGLGFFIFND